MYIATLSEEIYYVAKNSKVLLFSFYIARVKWDVSFLTHSEPLRHHIRQYATAGPRKKIRQSKARSNNARMKNVLSV